MSVQRRSFFALKCQHDYWAEIPALSDISLCGGASFTLGASFWYSCPENDQILFQQKDVFTFGVKGGCIYFEAKNLGRFCTDASKEPRLVENEWNRADIVFNGTVLQIYVQGLKALEKPGAGGAYIDKKTRCRLGVMDGYLQEVSLYSRALTEQEILHLSFTHDVPLDQTELWADFDVFKPMDRGRHTLPLQLKGRCATVNLVYGFSPGRNGFALPYGAGQVNPGGLDSGELTLLAAVYPRELSAQTAGVDTADSDTVIFSNGVRGGEQTLCLGVEKDTGTPFFVLGKARFPFLTKLENNSWYQLSATVKGSDVSLFIDGSPAGTGKLSAPFVRTEAAELMIGNQMENGKMTRGFQGCVDMVAVFDVALPAERLAAYADVPPYRFEEDLAALWLFSDQYPAEIVNGAVLTYSSGLVGCTLQENTVLEQELPAFSFCLPDTCIEMDEMASWETRVAAEAILQGMKAVTGMEPSGGFIDPDEQHLNGSIAELVAKNTSGSIQLATLTETGHLKGDDLRDIIDSAYLGAWLGAAFYAFYRTLQNDGLRRVALCHRFTRFFNLAWSSSTWPSIGSALGAGAAAVVKYVNKNPAPDSGTCTNKDYTITIRSLAFYHEHSKDAGALFGLPDFGGEAVLPEWSRTGDNVVSAPVLYHRDIPAGKTPSVVLTFYCEKKCEVPVEITFSATCMEGDGLDDVLGAPSSTNITVTATGEYSVTLPLPEHKLKTAALTAHKIRWNWLFSSPDIGKQLGGKTDHTIHVLAAKPLLPWTTEPGSYCPPTYTAVTLCQQVASQDSALLDPDRRFAEQFVLWCHNSGKLKAHPWESGSQYAAWGMDENRMLAFAADECVAALGSGTTQVGALDCACLHYVLTRLEGLDQLRLFHLSTGDRGDLCLRVVRRIGAAEDDDLVLLQDYPVCGIPAKNGPPDIWDCFLTLRGSKGDVTAIGLPFSEPDPTMDIILRPDERWYRNLLCEPGGTCEVTLTVSHILMERLPPQKIVPGMPVLDVVPGPRPAFDRSIQNSIPLEPYPVRCHSISYHAMETVVATMVNALELNQIDSAQFSEALLAVCSAVTLAPDSETYALASNKVHYLSSLTDFTMKLPIARQAELLVTALNNSEKNLRLGMSDWNSSVGEYFDPTQWAHISVPFDSIDGKHIPPILNSTNEGLNISQPLDDNCYLGAHVRVTGFYLGNPNDATRLKLLKPYRLLPGFRPLCQCVCAELIEQSSFQDSPFSNNRLKILYSSSNKWLLRDFPCATARISTSFIYYLDDLGDGPVWCSFWGW